MAQLPRQPGQTRHIDVDAALRSVSREARSHEHSFVLTATDAGLGVVELAAAIGGVSTAEIGVPVTHQTIMVDVAVSWLSDNVPGGDWTATLQRRAEGATAWVTTATFDFTTG